MRLINTSTLTLEEFPNSNLPYAILSHTWVPGEEVTYQEMTSSPRSQTTLLKTGWHKIKKACSLARRDYKLDYAWVDTVCIDKSSSAELSEAINSMYRWYQDAHVCIAFLSDFQDDEESFQTSRWFRRGWTLQELIAPALVVFFDWRWRLRGTKKTMGDRITEATNIPLKVLQHEVPLSDVPVAARMAWASFRETTREEDLAYCLLGLFDINMPMLYGEGKKAFLRLQEEIIKQSTDMSIFLWTDTETRQKYTGLLAPAPSCFRDVAAATPEEVFTHRSYTISNRGIEFKHRLSWDETDGLAILSVNHGTGTTKSAGIYLRRAGEQFVRALPSLYAAANKKRTMSDIVVVTKLSEIQSLAIDRNVLRISELPDWSVLEVEPPGCFDPTNRLVHAGFTVTFLGYMTFQKHNHSDSYRFALVFCFTLGKWGCKLVDLSRLGAYRNVGFYEWGAQHIEELRTEAWRGSIAVPYYYGRPSHTTISAALDSDPHQNSPPTGDQASSYVELREEWKSRN